jgi:deoxyribonuclease V
LCFPRGRSGYGEAGDPAWAAASLVSEDGLVSSSLVEGEAGARYEAGLLALREGPLLEAAVRNLPCAPNALLVNATGRDHPRRAGLALNLGAILDIPTVGVTHRPLVARGEWPEPERGACSPLDIDGEVVGYWVCTKVEARPLAVHAAWRTDPETGRELLLAATNSRIRTPEPLRQSRRTARTARASGTSPAARKELQALLRSKNSTSSG